MVAVLQVACCTFRSRQNLVSGTVVARLTTNVPKKVGEVLHQEIWYSECSIIMYIYKIILCIYIYTYILYIYFLSHRSPTLPMFYPHLTPPWPISPQGGSMRCRRRGATGPAAAGHRRLQLCWSATGRGQRTHSYWKWIGLRENLQETIDFSIKYGASL